MEFEELQKIWNSQKGETMYAINESALHSSITRKKDGISRKINMLELALIFINSTCALILFIDSIIDNENSWDHIGATILALTVVFLLFFRQRRLKKENTFDRTMLGELDHAIANSQSILQIATMMIYYYLLPVAVFSIGKMIYFGASLERWLLILGMFALALFLIRWERQNLHIPRKKRLIELKKKIMEP
ncbi:MAG: hypothetical protein AAFY41_08585 [Bacteroidota bacterium]